MLRSIMASAIAALVIAGCDEPATAPSDVVSRTWQLVSLQEGGSDPLVVPDPSAYTFRLDDNGRVSVKSDCNSCGTSYSLSESSSTIQIGRLACTLVACRQGSLDPRFAQALEGSKTVTLDGSQLTLRGNGVTLRFASE
jgi:heat shock protein HslJ